MSSIELKPVGTSTAPTPQNMAETGENMSSGIETLWSCQRSPPPPGLIGLVPDEMWGETWDKVKQQKDKLRDLELEQSKLGVPCICPCCIPCELCCGLPTGGLQRHMQMGLKIALAEKEGWTEILQSEQPKYAQYNVHVSYATDMVTRGIGDRRHSVQKTVGLKFDVASGGAGIVTTTTVVATVPAEAGAGETPAQRLMKAKEMLDAGLITQEEFDQKKGELLQSV
jgi:hypothetical protein